LRKWLARWFKPADPAPAYVAAAPGFCALHVADDGSMTTMPLCPKIRTTGRR